MRQERPVVGKRDGPPQPLQANPILPTTFANTDDRAKSAPSGQVRCTTAILHQQLRGDLGVARLVHAPRALAPDRGQLLPPPQFPVSNTSSASAKLDFPLPLRPTTTVSPGPGCRLRGAGWPIPRKPLTLSDRR